jgi:hypothetical protein
MTRYAVLTLAFVVGATPAVAQKLTIGAAAPATSLDPHFYNSSPTTNVATHFFEMLVARDAQARPVAALAKSWKPVSETAWEFKLRPGVRWHDGRDFKAEDVVFSLACVPAVPNSPGSFAPMVRAIVRVGVMDPATLRLHTAAPHPLLPNELGSIFMVSKHAGEGRATEDYNQGRAMIGTGLYRLVSSVAGDRVEVVRYDGHWAGRPAWESVSYRFIPNDGARTAALLAGDIDMMDQVPATEAARLRHDRRVQVSEIPGFRLLYMQVDHSHSSEPPFVTDTTGGRSRPTRARMFGSGARCPWRSTARPSSSASWKVPRGRRGNSCPPVDRGASQNTLSRLHCSSQMVTKHSGERLSGWSCAPGWQANDADRNRRHLEFPKDAHEPPIGHEAVHEIVGHHD